MEERRKYPRYKFSHKVTYGNPTEPHAVKKDALTANVSRGGACLRLDDEIAEGNILGLKVHTSPDQKPVNADAKVIWGRKMEDDSVMVGLAFTKIGWMESERLFKP